MVDGPFTRSEAAERCRCKPEELCPGPLAGIDESDKIRTIYDGSKGGANAHIQAHTEEKTTAPMVGDCLHAIHWLRTAADHPHLLRAPSSGTDEEPRDVHQPVQGQSAGAEGPERDPHSTSLPSGAERALIGAGDDGDLRVSPVNTLQGRRHSQVPRALIGVPHSPQPPQARNALGGAGPLTWQPPTQGETFIILKADVTKAQQAHKSAPERLEIPGGLHPEPVVGQ